jgi:S1-C subfamily serine protease
VSLGGEQALAALLQAAHIKADVEGVVVLDVSGGAASAGLKATTRSPDGDLDLGDVIQKVNGQVMKEASDVFKFIAAQKPGAEVTVTVFHLEDKSPEDLKVKLSRVTSDQQEKALEQQEEQEAQEKEQMQFFR